MPANKQVGYGSGEPFTKRRWSKWHGGFLACSGEKSLVRLKGGVMKMEMVLRLDVVWALMAGLAEVKG